MAADGVDIDAVLDGWRATGADRVDPLRFQRIAALQRRAAAHAGLARQALDARLAGLIDAYAGQLDARHVERRPADADAAHADDTVLTRDAGRSTTARGTARSVLGQLVDDMAPCAPAGHDSDADRPHRAGYPTLAALDDFRQLWSTLRTGSQVRRSLADVPTGAGPLNSAALAHRALTLMGGLSPEYLRQFLAYVDTLSWLDTLQDAGVLTGKEAAQQPVGAKPRKPRARKRG